MSPRLLSSALRRRLLAGRCGLCNEGFAAVLFRCMGKAPAKGACAEVLSAKEQGNTCGDAKWQRLHYHKGKRTGADLEAVLSHSVPAVGYELTLAVHPSGHTYAPR